MMAKQLVKRAGQMLLPPFFFNAAKFARGLVQDQDELFDGHSEAFRRYVARAEVYGEYGVGLSTDYVLSLHKTPVLAVDTSKAWVAVVRDRNATAAAFLQVEWVDVGQIGNWGKPIGYSHREAFSEYARSIWLHEKKPDTILIDGRFRVQCFLCSLLMADAGSVLIFDDYCDRPEYHVVEEFARPVETCGRQAVFRVPASFDRVCAKREMERFSYVLD